MVNKINELDKEEMKTAEFLPYFFCGQVIRGYGRGGKELNCPTGMFLN